MSLPTPLSGLGAIAADYDVLLCDVWGVLHNGRESYPAACAALQQFADKRGPVVLISNAARPASAVVDQLDQLGVPRTAWSAFVTSGDATRPLLSQRAPGPAWAIGPELAAKLYDGLGLSFAEPEDAAFIVCTGPFDDEVETPEDYRARFEVCLLRGLEMICANPDIVVQRGDKLIYCGGALAQLYADLGGRVVMAGKPHPPIYDLALAEGQRLLGGALDRTRVLCIGDGLPTDVRGALHQKLDCLFVAGGIHRAEVSDASGALDPAAAAHRLASDGLVARYLMADLSW
jgi:HAD superfamily hydrolase (TIGR01459 family)